MKLSLIGLAAAFIAAGACAASASPLSEQDAAKIASDAYVYGYPLVLMDLTRAVGTATPKPAGFRAPANQFVHMRAFPDANFKYVVAPNADTLYSSAWLDLSRGPVMLSVPDTGRRYHLLPMLDAWTNVFAAPGSRTTGNGKGEFAIVGPGWTGSLPAGVEEVKAPTNMVWIIGRTQTNGKADYAAVHAIQDQYRITPASAWDTPYTPPAEVPVAQGIDTKTPPAEQVAKMDAATFFSRLNALMASNPPAAADAPALARFAQIGVAPGKAFDERDLGEAGARGVESGVHAGFEEIMAAVKTPPGKVVNHWTFLGNAELGRYGTNYLLRATVARMGLGANLREDAVYPNTAIDADGAPLSGANRYVIHIPKAQLPPVHAFWSLTMYGADHYFVDNPINRYAIGDRDALKFNADGSLDLYIQHAPPDKDEEANWLPAPEGRFSLSLRLYWPKAAAVDGGWMPPAVKRVN